MEHKTRYDVKYDAYKKMQTALGSLFDEIIADLDRRNLKMNAKIILHGRFGVKTTLESKNA